MPSQRAHLLGLVFASLVFGSCASRGAQLQPARTASPASDIEFSLYLIGDAGEPAPGGEPVLRALTATMEGSPGQAAVVFLGDNIYPKGLPPLGGPTRPEMERRLLDQIAAVRAPARGLFVPGNHDWEKSGPGGLASIQAQQAFISAHGDGDRITMSPSGGCPGPVTIDDLSPRLRVVAIDTQWWLHAYDKGEAHCSAGTELQVLVALDAALATAGTRHVVLVAHHPLQSSGWHAGHFNWQDHLFPLTRVAKPLWIPLPGIGSLYPLFRITKPSPQDLGSREYSHLRAALGDVLRKHRPLLYAGGHEHELEVLKGDSARFFVVSGAGIYGHLTPTRRRAETLFRGTASGFMRIDLLQDGHVRLLVFAVDGTGAATQSYSTALDFEPT